MPVAGRRNGVENAFCAAKNALAFVDRHRTRHGSGQPRSRTAGAQRSEQGTVVPLRRAGACGQASRFNCSCSALSRCGRSGARARTLPKKAQALLAYLAMQDGRAVPREQLAELLWGASGGEQARRSLRQCLMSVRAALKAGGGMR